MLHIYDTKTKRKREFKPLVKGEVSFYVCGVTVYDECHIGHARSYIVFDMIIRYLHQCGYKTHYVRNITDIDDKIINRANHDKQPFNKITKTYIKSMRDDFAALNILPADEEPRATKFIDSIIDMVQVLLNKGYAYIAENGDVLFSVEKFSDYGQLSNQNIDELRASGRIEIDQSKRSALDFVLWKLAKPEEPAWHSPWGDGRPGWHIECSVMATHCLGNRFDIHGGGLDLQFPHHENEIAQAVAATDESFAQCWMHAGLLQVNGEKMSKSLNNFFTIRDVLNYHDPEAVRYFMLASHYRSPVNYSEDNLNQAKQALDRLYTALRGVEFDERTALNDEYVRAFHEAMDDDFNTPVALSVLFDLVRELNKQKKQNNMEGAKILAYTLKRLGNVFGLLEQSSEQFLQGIESDKALIETLIGQREEARKDKDWAEADRVRNELLELGIVLEDKAEGTLWRRE